MSEEQKAQPTRWSADGMVCYVDGAAFGIKLIPYPDNPKRKKAQTVYLGKAEEVLKHHPLAGRVKQPLVLKFGRKNRFSEAGILRKW